ncbi:5-methyltetrahydrofolate--homocysteine methyltransferase [Tistlia consotensis]|uniref:5-methyltetrahydrofolate--homocysteine methyltransferase n=1 Tax=Tistlia consotensis USBA 355 TaxID=560819 RepID=A0A1Y6CGH0_9PROT|nr:betaine--homocysteine S-methyltransferase [Tistlia consotensis]SMF53894.1 5-methyltetrahydrofolate--homocysteine methyltransferase [Tistlia consotensis USBA 355]SNR86203.1 5-methyltetrahydrofolate--homocysteine methyltransferase [Tistlia consotensis]
MLPPERPFALSDLLTTLLSERPWLIADGATGTNLFAMGLQHGDAPELWNLEQPEKVRAHYRSFIEAGSDIVLTNTFGGTANRLRLHGAQDRVFQINEAAARLLVEEIATAGRRIVCAGSVGPTGDLLEPLGPLTYEQAVAAFRAQCEGLKAGGADLAWIETMSSPDELKAAIQGATEAGLPVTCTLSFDTNGRTMMGVTPVELAGLAHDSRPAPLAFGGNCGTGAAELVAALVQMRDATGPTDVVIAKANCGIPVFIDGEVVYNGTPELMARYAVMARDAGARIIGGCCGTTPEHIRAMRSALEASEPGPAPSVEEVVAALGSVSAGGLGQAPGEGAGRRGGRRRRG